MTLEEAEKSMPETEDMQPEGLDIATSYSRRGLAMEIVHDPTRALYLLAWLLHLVNTERKAALVGLDRRCADLLADEVDVLVRRKIIDFRSPAADALIDYRNNPSTPRSDRLLALESALATERKARFEAEAKTKDAWHAHDNLSRARWMDLSRVEAERDALKADIKRKDEALRKADAFLRPLRAEAGDSLATVSDAVSAALSPASPPEGGDEAEVTPAKAESPARCRKQVWAGGLDSPPYRTACGNELPCVCHPNAPDHPTTPEPQEGK